MANLPEHSSSISYTSPSNVSNGSLSIAAFGGSGSSGSNGSSELVTSLDIVSLNKLSSNLEVLLNQDTEFDCTDAEIEVEGRMVGVHRCILAARSSFFRKKFSEKTSGSPGGGKVMYKMEELLPFGHVGYEAFRDFLGYVYTGRPRQADPDVSTCVDKGCAHVACRPAINFAVELMYASYVFQIEELVLLLQRRLLNFVDKAFVEDVIPILVVGFHSKHVQLVDHCVHRVARSNLDDISIHKELPIEVVEKIKLIRCKPKPKEPVDPAVDTQEKRIKRIHRALDSDDVELVKMLLSESKVTLDDVNALHYAAAYCDSKVVTEVLELGLANVNLQNSRGYTPLHVAAMRREPAVIMSLLRKGAFASELTEDGRSAICICRRLTRPKDYNARTEKCKESNTDQICINILEREMWRNPMTGEESITSPSFADNLQMKLLYLENRVSLAKLFFPSEAKLAMQIAETTSKYALCGSRGSSGNLKEVDLNETPAMRTKRLRMKMDALNRTVELGRRYFPHCSEVLDNFMADDMSEQYYFEDGASDEQDLKRRRYYEIKEDVLKAFSKDRAKKGFSGLSSSSSSSPPIRGDKRQHRKETKL